MSTVAHVTKLFTGQWDCRCHNIIERETIYRTWTGTQIFMVVPGTFGREVWPGWLRWRMFRNYRLTVFATGLATETAEVIYSSDRDNYGFVSSTMSEGAPMDVAQGTSRYLTQIDAFETALSTTVDPDTKAVEIVQRCLIDDRATGLRLANLPTGRRRLECFNEVTFDDFMSLVAQDYASETIPTPRQIPLPLPNGIVQDYATRTTSQDIYWSGDNRAGQNMAEIHVSSFAAVPFCRLRTCTAILPGMHSYKRWPGESVNGQRIGTAISCTNFRVPCGGRFDLRLTMDEDDLNEGNGQFRRVADIHFDQVCPP